MYKVEIGVSSNRPIFYCESYNYINDNRIALFNVVDASRSEIEMVEISYHSVTVIVQKIKKLPSFRKETPKVVEEPEIDPPW